MRSTRLLLRVWLLSPQPERVSTRSIPILIAKGVDGEGEVLRTRSCERIEKNFVRSRFRSPSLVLSSEVSPSLTVRRRGRRCQACFGQVTSGDRYSEFDGLNEIELVVACASACVEKMRSSARGRPIRERCTMSARADDPLTSRVMVRSAETTPIRLAPFLVRANDILSNAPLSCRIPARTIRLSRVIGGRWSVDGAIESESDEIFDF